jgi:uncharacterized protein YkwD
MRIPGSLALLVLWAGCARAGTPPSPSTSADSAGAATPPDHSTLVAETPPSPDTTGACPQTPGQLVLEEVNRIRAEAGLPRLSVDLRLVAAAMTQARDIAAGAPVGHVGLDGSLPDQRARKEGYAWSRVGENVAAGVATAKEVVADWMSSEHHRENILGGGFKQIGVAFVDMRSSAYGTYWVQVFASPLDPKASGRPARCNP